MKASRIVPVSLMEIQNYSYITCRELIGLLLSWNVNQAHILPNIKTNRNQQVFYNFAVCYVLPNMHVGSVRLPVLFIFPNKLCDAKFWLKIDPELHLLCKWIVKHLFCLELEDGQWEMWVLIPKLPYQSCKSC